MMIRLLSFILALALSLGAFAQTERAKADSAYAREDYKTALSYYKKVEPSAAVNYNMGNCYYRLNDIAHAILYYERAQLLSPSNGDIRFNLAMARGKTVDKLVPRHEFFFVDWYRSLAHAMSVDAWAYLAICSFMLALLGLVCYLFLYTPIVRRLSMTLSVVMFVVCLTANLFSYSQHQDIERRSMAIVMHNVVPVKSTPSASGKDLFVLHEGTRVDIVDDTLQGWLEIELQDGKKGWLSADALEII